MLSKNNINEDNYINESNNFHKGRKTLKKYKHYKKTGNKCYWLNMLEHFGIKDIIIIQNMMKEY